MLLYVFIEEYTLVYKAFIKQKSGSRVYTYHIPQVKLISVTNSHRFNLNLIMKYRWKKCSYTFVVWSAYHKGLCIKLHFIHLCFMVIFKLNLLRKWVRFVIWNLKKTATLVGVTALFECVDANSWLQLDKGLIYDSKLLYKHLK